MNTVSKLSCYAESLNSDISKEFITYAKPWIQGKVDVPMKGGLPDFAYRR